MYFLFIFSTTTSLLFSTAVSNYGSESDSELRGAKFRSLNRLISRSNSGKRIGKKHDRDDKKESVNSGEFGGDDFGDGGTVRVIEGVFIGGGVSVLGGAVLALVSKIFPSSSQLDMEATWAPSNGTISVEPGRRLTFSGILKEQFGLSSVWGGGGTGLNGGRNGFNFPKSGKRILSSGVMMIVGLAHQYLKGNHW